jgi:TolB-like protein/DNA-binding winged helix-turn-helix (wHTH) protein/Tfp pilus assembly protein PilF
MSSPVKHFYEFGPFRIDPIKRRLLRDGQPVPLAPKVFDTLQVLVESGGLVLEKEELMKRIWPDSFVEEGNLSLNIFTLRKALGESPSEHHYIVTLPGRGYRFVAEVRTVGEESPRQILQERTRSSLTIEVEEETSEEGVSRRAPASSTSPEESLIAHAGLGSERSGGLLTRRSLVSILALVWLVIVGAILASFMMRGPAIDSLAVLPLGTGSAEADYLSDGITESIINNLSQLPRLRVMARSTVFKYKGKEVDPQQVGRELHVRVVLISKLMQQGDTLVITTELVNVADGSRLWGERYQRKLPDILAVQEEIAQHVSEKLRFTLTGEEKRRLAKRYTENATAYSLYLKGRYYLSYEYNEAGFIRGLGAFKQALNLDPGYAPAWVGMADAYYWMSNLYRPPTMAMPMSKAAAQAALDLDETLAEAHVSMAVVKSLYEWDWTGAELDFKRALELNPGYAPAHHMYGLLLSRTGKTEEALAQLKRARELDPLSTSIAVTAVGPLVFAPPSARQPDRAIEELREIIRLDANFPPAHSLLAEAYAQKGKFQESIAEYSLVQQLDKSAGALGFLGLAHARNGERDKAHRFLADLQERLDRGEHITALAFAGIYTSLGEKDQAFAWLDKAYEAHDEELSDFKVDPKFDSLRSDGRYIRMLKRLNLFE